MAKVILTLVLCSCIFVLTMSANTRMSDPIAKDGGSTGPMIATINQESSNNEEKDLDMDTILNECNETFRIQMGYLESLNESGSFIDETDKTPKCFVRCMLESMDVMSKDNGMIDPAKAAKLFAGERNGQPIEDIGDMTALCAVRKETCPCERAYMFMRCLMSMEIEKYESTQ